MSTNPLRIVSLGILSPSLTESNMFLKSSGEPMPYMQDTLATTTTSFRSRIEAVARSLSLSISSFIEASFSI